MGANPGGAHKVAVGVGKVVRSSEEPRWGRRAPAPTVLVVGLLGTMAMLAFSFGAGSRMSIALPRTELVRKPAAAASPARDKPTSSSRHDQDGRRLLGGLLSPAFDEHSCRSRYASSSSPYRRASPFRPSSYLVERLRRYEARHRRCGPGSPPFKEAVEHLRSGRNAVVSECQYVVWTPFNSLGNRILALASTFLYALLTDRVLLVHVPPEFDGLFCDPFPGSSWTLPADFPITDFEGTFTMTSLVSYKNMKQAGVVSSDSVNVTLPPYVFLDLIQSFTDAAFCEVDQRVLARLNWMVVKSDVYFATAFFLALNMYDQLTRCIREQRLLPELGEPMSNTTADGKVKAVLIASLYPGYYDKIRGLYYENPTKTGEIVAVYEEKQEYTSNEHNQKALPEIYLLSYCDKIAMSAWSTFGYVAYGFAGVKPWILLRPDWDKEVSQVACVRSTSVEPCLHSPPILGCMAKLDVDVAKVKPYVRHCEDVGFGLKLFDN